MTYRRTWPAGCTPSLSSASFRSVLGRLLATNLRVDIALSALELRVGPGPRRWGSTGLVHHSDKGVPYVALPYTHSGWSTWALSPWSARPATRTTTPWRGAFNSLFKAELMRSRGPWRSIVDIEITRSRSTSTGSTIDDSTARSGSSHPWSSKTRTTAATPVLTPSRRFRASINRNGTDNPCRVRGQRLGVVVQHHPAPLEHRVVQAEKYEHTCYQSQNKQTQPQHDGHDAQPRHLRDRALWVWSHCARSTTLSADWGPGRG